MSDAVPHALYRLFGDGDVLLYIGISKTFGYRWHQHAQEKIWWPEVRRQEIAWFPSKEEALDAEGAAIRAECPHHNIVHNNGRPRPAAAAEVAAPAGRRSRAATDAKTAALPPLPRLTREQIERMPITLDLMWAGTLLGLGRTKAYALARAGTFPCQVLQLGHRRVVTKTALLKAHGLEWHPASGIVTGAAA